jgi:large subunit ribosomal protein L24e
MTVDAVLDFEQRRNVPVRYNRTLMVKTIQAMKRIEEIRGQRQKRLFERRMAKAHEKKKKDVESELVKHVDLISDTKVKGYILRKKQEKTDREMKKWQANKGSKKADVNSEDEVMQEDEEQETTKIMQKLSINKKSKKIKK